jgi:acid phosphatase class B
MDILSLFSGRHNKNRIRLTKSVSGENWTVKKGHSILYIGSREKCEKYLEHHLISL